MWKMLLPFPHFLLRRCTTSSFLVAAFPRGFLLSLISFTVCTTRDQAPLSTEMPFQTLLLTWVPVSPLPYSKRNNSNPLPETGIVFDKQCLPAVRNQVPRKTLTTADAYCDVIDPLSIFCLLIHAHYQSHQAPPFLTVLFPMAFKPPHILQAALSPSPNPQTPPTSPLSLIGIVKSKGTQIPWAAHAACSHTAVPWYQACWHALDRQD